MISFRNSIILLFISYGFCQTYDELKAQLPERPLFNGAMGKYLNYPGLAFEPNFDGLIRFNKARMSTIVDYTSRLNSKLIGYQNIFQENLRDCSSFRGYRRVSDWGYSCRFDMTVLGADCTKQNSYGYEDGQPCIALSLERIMNWLPEPYTNDTVPDKIRDIWNEYGITVHCETDDPVSKDNIGDITYHPQEGFMFKYFPNLGNDGWMNPMVFVRLENANPAVVIRVTCSVYAKNIKHYDKLETGKVSFDVMID